MVRMFTSFAHTTRHRSQTHLDAISELGITSFSNLQLNKTVSEIRPTCSSHTQLHKTVSDIKTSSSSHTQLNKTPVKFNISNSSLIQTDKNEHFGSVTNLDIYGFLGSGCTGSITFRDAQRFHCQSFKTGFAEDLFLSNTLINSYAKNGSLNSSRQVFDEMPQRNNVSWSCIITGYVYHGLGEEASKLFCAMWLAGFEPSHFSLSITIRACQDSRNLQLGRQIHGLISKTRFGSDTVVCNSLMGMYGRCCDSMEQANQVFDEMSAKNSISWNSIISLYSQRGDCESAVGFFSQMQLHKSGLQPNEYTLASLITCSYSSHLSCLVKQLVARVTKSGYLGNLYVGSSLVSTFARFGLMDDAWKVFYWMGQRNAVSMNGLMVGFVKQKRCEEAVEIYGKMRDLVDMNCDSYVVLLSACAGFWLEEEGKRRGKEVHGFVIINGLDSKVAIGNGLVNMYAKCGAIDEAFKVFDSMVFKDLVSWNSMITGLDQNGCFKEPILLYCRMLEAGLLPANLTLVSALSSCATLGCIREGSQIHCQAIKLGLDSDISVSNSLLTVYAESGRINDCRKVFNLMQEHDQISWNSMIGVLANSELSITEATEIFLAMMRAGWSLNKVTFINILAALSSISVLEYGRQVHALSIKHGLMEDSIVENALLSCYAKCGGIGDCEHLFSKMSPRRDVVSWNSMIVGYIHNGLLSKAMDFLWFMMQMGHRMDSFAFATVLSVCATIAALDRGMQIHAISIRACLDPDIVVDSVLIDMYSKCGRLDYASRVFALMSLRNKFSWNSMICGYARHGHGEKALDLFKKMIEKGNQRPDHVTFVGVLSACSHVGLVEQGFEHFESMSYYGLVPQMEHYSCMVDLLGRAGELGKIKDFIKMMPMKPNALVWRTVVGACWRANGGYDELGNQAAEMLLELEPQNPVNYVLMSNMYAAGGRWEEVARARALMRAMQMKKEAGCSWVTMKDGIHVFIASDKSHPETNEIYAKLQILNQQLRDAGYVPQTKFALYDLELENKEELLSYHSERLAVAFVLTRTSSLPIRIMKNLRVCGDCHSALGYISKVTARQIIVRDSNRFHHFNDGKCSCGDYW